MTSHRRRSGSALIIVLGFLAFMVVSAVSFSIYMRTERVASSGFHRSASVRQMVKAGVANAIAQIDAAVGNDPFPGLQVYPGSGGDYGLDHWMNCVFMPYKSASPGITVPVIPLEGLAYLPPALVNEVRATARSTYSAQWQNLDYDVGRFAYVAVNVSDFFDINKLRFSMPRSTGPGGHVSLSYLFQNDQGTSLDVAGSKLLNLDDFLDSRGGGESQVPFVSLADFNTALFKKDQTGSNLGIYSPFFSYLKAGSARAFYSQGGDEAYELLDRAGRMLFVTDSWQVPTNRADEVIDLSKDEDQPFPKAAFSESKTFATLLQSLGRAYNERLNKEISITTLANLYDYLDDNSVPLSLGVPNVERVPMVAVVNGTTLTEQLQMTVKAESKDENYSRGGQQGQGQSLIKRTTTYKLLPQATAPMVNVVCMYPFKGPTKREGETSAKTYKVQVIAKIFFTKDDGAAGGWSGRCVNGNGICPTKSEWDSENKAKVDNNCITLISRKTPVNFPSEVFEDNEAVFDTMVTLPSMAQLNSDLDSKFLLQVQSIFRQTENGGYVAVDEAGFPKASTFKILPFGPGPGKGGAQVVGTVTPGDSQTDVEVAQATCWGMKLTPHLAMWARVVDDKEKTVDLAPAWMANDELNGGLSGVMGMTLNTKMGDGSQHAPMLAASGSKQVVFSAATDHKVYFEGAEEDTPVKLFEGSASAFAALDPRFNNSPEDFIAKSSGLAKDGYLQEVRKLLGNDRRDPDIFMFASDQQYLQSIGELSYLPNIGELGEYDSQSYPYAKCTVPQTFKEDIGQMDAQATHRSSFWRTYPLYRQRNDGYSDEDYIFRYFSSQIEAGDKVIVNDVNGFKVNPYSTIEKIRLAATANTPHSFWASSTNTVIQNNRPPCFTGPGKPKQLDECFKYCFNQMNGNVGPELAWRDVTNMTAYVFNHMRSDALARKDWESSFASLSWYPEPGDPGLIFDNYSLDDASDDLHSVDRKMLYSFWHDSLANRQQLFLVFVRVEAIPLGASDNASTDIMPPQHGGRAVALVWRDPNTPTNGKKVQWRNQTGGSDLFGCALGSGTAYTPHRTRLLFYHQFE